MEYNDPPPQYEGPPSYESVMNEMYEESISPNRARSTGLMVKDFSPESPNVTFQMLVFRANDWLQANPYWEVKTCESVECKIRNDYSTYNTNDATFYDYPFGTRYMQRLRLWLTLRNNQSAPQQINYINVVPRQLATVLPENGRTAPNSHMPRYERLDSFMVELNSTLRQNPISGRILNINMRSIKLTSHLTVDPDLVYYSDFGFSVFSIRIFYEVGPILHETVGLIDFFPKHLNIRGAIGASRYESVPGLVASASLWFSQQENIRICGMQTIPLELQPALPNRVDSMQMFICENRNQGQLIKYLRILRVCYVRMAEPEQPTQYLPLSGPISCKTFLPVQMTNGISEDPTFETVSLTLIRIAEWVRKHNADIISSESFPVKMYILPEEREGPDVTYFYKDAIAERFIWIFRLYLNGYFPDPPRSMCPAAYNGWWTRRVKDSGNQPLTQAPSGDCCLS